MGQARLSRVEDNSGRPLGPGPPYLHGDLPTDVTPFSSSLVLPGIVFPKTSCLQRDPDQDSCFVPGRIQAAPKVCITYKSSCGCTGDTPTYV